MRGHRLFDPRELDDVVLHPPIAALPRPLATRRPGGLSRRALGTVGRMVPPLRRVSIHGYRAARELELDARLRVRARRRGVERQVDGADRDLDAARGRGTAADDRRRRPRRGRGRIRLEADVAKGTIFLDARPPDTLNLNRAGAPPVLFLPANLRSRTLVAPATGTGRSRRRRALPAAARRAPLGRRPTAASQLVAGMERLLASNLRRFVLLIEEPELYLSPHAQRHLFRVLRELAQRGQPDPLLDARAGLPQRRPDRGARARASHARPTGTSLFQPEPLAEAEAFRVLSEFDSDRAELFLARAALLVEGRTEKLTFPLVFEALGVEPDKEGILVLECGGKGNMPLFARICNACGDPVRDRARPRRAEGRSGPSSRSASSTSRSSDVAGRRRTVVLDAGLRGRVRHQRRADGAASRGRRTGATRGNGDVPPSRSAWRSRRC